MQDCSISIADTLEILQSCTKPSIQGISTWTVKIVVTVMPARQHTFLFWYNTEAIVILS